MPPGLVEELGRDRFQIDLQFRDQEGLIASYALPGPAGWTLVETGPSTCRENLTRGLMRAGIEPAAIRRVLVTHIHLDHAGGLGALAGTFPNATLYVHREGFTHLVEPSKLIASAHRAWGPAANSLWGEILPVPPGRLVALVGGERFPVVGGDLLAVYTPGHAKHHLAFYDEPTRSLITGDAAGVHLPGTDRVRPALPPPDLDVEALLTSVERMIQLGPDRLLYTHFGRREAGIRALAEYPALVIRWREVALEAAREEPTVDHVAAALQGVELGAGGGILDSRPDLISGTALAAQGLLRYFRTRGLIS